MHDLETARAYLDRNRLLYLNMLEVLRRGTGEVRYAGEEGVLLRDAVGGAWFLTARTERTLEEQLRLLPPHPDLLVGHEPWYRERLAQLSGASLRQICYVTAWTGAEPPEAPPCGGELRLLDEGWAETVFRHYSHAFGTPAYIAGAIRRGMVGAFVDGGLAGFVGTHEEGTVGLLEVLPQYRRRGLGRALLLSMVRLVLSRGAYAVGEVETNNAASLALQRAAGMTVSEDTLFWLIRE